MNGVDPLAWMADVLEKLVNRWPASRIEELMPWAWAAAKAERAQTAARTDRKVGRLHRFEPVAFCPGFARGLAFAGNLAFVGLSLARESRTFQGLLLDGALTAKGAVPRCGLIAVDVNSGDTVGWVRLEGVVRELYDIAVLPRVRRPAALGFRTDEITRIISIDESQGA